MSLFSKKQPPAPDLRLEALEAEYKNYRRRTQQAGEQAALDAQRKTVLAFLPLYDDLERALQAPCQDAAYRKGIGPYECGNPSYFPSITKWFVGADASVRPANFCPKRENLRQIHAAIGRTGSSAPAETAFFRLSARVYAVMPNCFCNSSKSRCRIFEMPCSCMVTP